MNRHRLSSLMFRRIALLLVVSHILLTWVCVYYTVQNNFSRTVNDQKKLLAQTSVNVGNLISEFKRVVYYLSGDQAIPEMLDDRERQVTDSFNFTNELANRFYAFTSAPITVYKLDYNSFLFLSEQFPVSNSLKKSVRFDAPARRANVASEAALNSYSWAERVAESNRALVCFVEPDAPDYLFFANELYNITLNDVRYSRYVGTAVFMIQQKAIHRMLGEMLSIAGSKAVLLDENTVLSGTDDALFMPGEEIDDNWHSAMNVKKDGSLQRVQCKSGIYYAARLKVDRQMSLLLLIPLESMNMMGDVVAATLISVCLSLLILSLLITRLVTQRVARPIMRLTEHMKQAPEEVGELSFNEPNQNTYELQMLYENYDQMIRTIHDLMEQQKQTLQDKQMSELRAMQAQINPHFIYNTLDAVSAIALMNGEEEIFDLVTELTELLKYSIRFQRQTVALEMELSFVLKYLHIQKIRLDNRFELNNLIGEEFYSYQIPKLTLQPLVENAIYYAYNEGQPLVISLEARLHAGMLMVSVNNNGTNCDAEQLNSYLRGEGDIQVHGEGVGVRNVHERIRLQYGERYGLRYENAESGGLRAVLVLPAQPLEQSEDYS